MGAGRQLLYLPPYSPNLNPINQVQDAIAQILLRPPRERRAEFAVSWRMHTKQRNQALSVDLEAATP
jgi:hypothetical protein